MSGAGLDQLSFAERSLLISGQDLHRYEAIRLVRDLARNHHSAVVAQLAAQMVSSMHSGDASENMKNKGSLDHAFNLAC